MDLSSGLMDGSSQHTLNIESMAWILYSPSKDLVSSGEIFLGPAMNNLVEYHVVIGLLTDSLLNDVS